MLTITALSISMLLAPGATESPSSAWIRAAAVPYSTHVPGSGLDDLAGLRAIVGDAKVVGLGESTHGTREAFQFKHRLVEYLVEREGFSIFAIEANMPESQAITDYVLGGEGDARALVSGLYFQTWNTEEVVALVEWMRSWNARNPAESGKPRLRFTGFDMQVPGVAWGIAHGFLETHAPELARTHAGVLKDLEVVTQRATPGNVTGGYASASGSLPAGVARGKTMRLSWWMRTEDVADWAGVWVQCMASNGPGAFKNSQDLGVKGNTEWTRRELVLEVPAETVGIGFGFILSGPSGAAWFDDVEFEFDGVKFEDPTNYTFDFENDAVNFLSGVAGEYAAGRVETRPHGGKKCLEIRRRPVAEVPVVDAGAVRARAAAVVSDMEARRAELMDKAGARATDWAIQNARVVAQCAAMYADPSGIQTRDAAMADNVRWIMAQHPGEKIVLWAHNGHVSRGGYMQMESMGTHLGRALGAAYLAVGFATGTGRYSAAKQIDGTFTTVENELQPPPVGSVEETLGAAGLPRFVLDLRGAKADDPGSGWARRSAAMRSIGGVATEAQFSGAVPGEMFDVLVWQAETTASRPLK